MIMKKILTGPFQWKMSFSPDPSKQTQEAISFRKLKIVSYPLLIFDKVSKSQKHLGILSDSKLTFQEHYQKILNNTKRTIELLSKLQRLLWRAALMTVYKDFIKTSSWLQWSVLWSSLLSFIPGKIRIHSVQCLLRGNWSNKEHP